MYHAKNHHSLFAMVAADTISHNLKGKARIIILALAPVEKSTHLYQFILTITVTLNDDTIRS
jgi:hypothetical protein